MVIENDVGFAYGGRRATADGQYYWRVTQFLMPMYALIPGPNWPRACVGVVPIDDHHTIRVQIAYDPTGPLAGPDRFTARELGEFQLSDGVVIDTWIPTENRGNRYNLDRDMQRRINYSGIKGIETQDRAMTEGMGYICDRTQEHLGTSEMAVIATRRILEKKASDLQKGVVPAAVKLHERFGARPLDVISPDDNLGGVLARYANEARMYIR